MKDKATLPFQRWPEADQSVWNALTTQAAGPLDDAGALSHLRPASLNTLRTSYSRWLAWLQINDPEVLAELPARRGTPERLQAWMNSLDSLSPMSRSFLFDGALRVMTAAAPEEDWTRQWRLRAWLRRAALANYGQRKQGRILSSSVLLQAGLELAGPQGDAAPTILQAMRNRRDGLMVAFLALLPLRLRSFHALELGRTVLRADGRILISLPSESTKNGHPWEAPVPDVVTPPFLRYMDEARPWLMARGGATHNMLWVQDRGRAYPWEYLRLRIATVTTSLTGVRVPAHFFRDAAATTLARGSPAAARLIRPLLGHADYGTAEKHYIHAQGIEAGRDYASVVAQLKQEPHE